MRSGEGHTMGNFIVYTVHLISSQCLNIRLRWADQIVRVEEGKSAFNILTSKTTGKRSLGRPRHRWEDDIKMDLKVWIRGILLIRLRIEIIGEPWRMRH